MRGAAWKMDRLGQLLFLAVLLDALFAVRAQTPGNAYTHVTAPRRLAKTVEAVKISCVHVELSTADFLFYSKP